MRHFLSGSALMVALTGLLSGTDRAEAQAVAFQPQIGSLPDGVQMDVVPVVSADRRYVRLSLGVGFQTINGFQSFGVPAAVGGGGNGGGTFGGAGGGFGGTGVGGGVAGGGFRSVTTGMDGTINPGMAPSGYGGGFPTAYGYGYDDYGMGHDAGYVPPAPKARRSRTTRAKVTRAKPAAAKG